MVLNIILLASAAGVWSALAEGPNWLFILILRRVCISTRLRDIWEEPSSLPCRSCARLDQPCHLDRECQCGNAPLREAGADGVLLPDSKYCFTLVTGMIGARASSLLADGLVLVLTWFKLPNTDSNLNVARRSRSLTSVLVMDSKTLYHRNSRSAC